MRVHTPSFVPQPRATRPMDPGVQAALLRQMQDDALAEQAAFESRMLGRTPGLWVPIDPEREAKLLTFMKASVDTHPQGLQAMQHTRGDVEGAFKTFMVWDVDSTDILPYLETAS